MLLLTVLLLFLFNNVLPSEAQVDLYDLTWDFGNETLYYPGRLPFVFRNVETIVKPGYRILINEYAATEHGGTHFDAPYNFDETGWKVPDVPISRLFPKGVLIDLTREHRRLGRNTRLRVQHLEDWERRNGKFPRGSVLLVQYGRSRLWPNMDRYFDIDSDGSLNFPGLSAEAARWIVESGKFYGVGVDAPSIDPGISTNYIVHRTLAKNSLYILENVKLLVDLPEKGFDLVVAPMKIEEGTGAPVRLIAKVPRERAQA